MDDFKHLLVQLIFGLTPGQHFLATDTHTCVIMFHCLMLTKRHYRKVVDNILGFFC